MLNIAFVDCTLCVLGLNLSFNNMVLAGEMPCQQVKNIVLN